MSSLQHIRLAEGCPACAQLHGHLAIMEAFLLDAPTHLRSRQIRKETSRIVAVARATRGPTTLGMRELLT